VTHNEVADLLPAYALGALEADAAEIDEHLRGCRECSELLATYLDAAAALGEAVPPVEPPAALRAAVLAHGDSSPRAVRRWEWTRRFAVRYAPLAAAVLLVLSAGLGAGDVLQQRQLGQNQSTLALDERGLALLTSTETTVDRLAPVVATTTNTHGHWYHRPGIQTQVFVVEFMPALLPDQAYYGWVQRTDGSWQLVGRFTLDATGYGRIILLGGDGTNVRGVTVTAQTGEYTTPSGTVVLRGPAS
jgi:hypothetical protein